MMVVPTVGCVVYGIDSGWAWRFNRGIIIVGILVSDKVNVFFSEALV